MVLPSLVKQGRFIKFRVDSNLAGLPKLISCLHLPFLKVDRSKYVFCCLPVSQGKHYFYLYGSSIIGVGELIPASSIYLPELAFMASI
jgi:hypothetical protein